MEQMLTAQIVGAHNAALDCLDRAAETDDAAQADRLRRSFATVNRSMRDTLQLLTLRQQLPAAVAPISPQQPMHREKARTDPAAAADPLDKDPAKTTDAELGATLTECDAALAKEEHPLHREAP
jgi:hypothetical protein